MQELTKTYTQRLPMLMITEFGSGLWWDLATPEVNLEAYGKELNFNAFNSETQ